MAGPADIILVVDDNALLRMSAIDMMENAGFSAIEAANAVEAVALLESRSDIRAVFSDIEMPPGPNGIDLATTISERWPLIEIILTSGYVAAQASDLPARTLFFTKPYREADVVAAMRRILT